MRAAIDQARGITKDRANKGLNLFNIMVAAVNVAAERDEAPMLTLDSVLSRIVIAVAAWDERCAMPLFLSARLHREDVSQRDRGVIFTRPDVGMTRAVKCGDPPQMPSLGGFHAGVSSSCH